MPSPVPTPVAAALGLVPTVLGGVRRLPGKAVQLPVYAVSHALTSLGAARQGYDDLAERGERLLARLRGTSFDEIEDVVEDSLQGTPLARPYDAVEDALEDVGEGVTALVRKGTSRARSAAGTATRSVGGSLDKAADTVEDAAGKATGTTASPGKATAKVAGAAKKAAGTTAKAAEKVASPDAAAKAVEAAEKAVQEAAEKAEQAAATAAEKAAAAGIDPAQADRERKNPDQAPKGEPTPAETQPDTTRVDTAASSDVVETVERVSSTVGGKVLDHDDLPLPDYDHLTLGSLRGRMRSLDLPGLIAIRDYEKAHADRLPIVTMLDNRIAKLASDPTAPLSGSAPSDAAQAPSKASGAKGTAGGGSKVTPKTADPAASNPTVAFGGLGGAGKPS